MVMDTLHFIVSRLNKAPFNKALRAVSFETTLVSSLVFHSTLLTLAFFSLLS